MKYTIVCALLFATVSGTTANCVNNSNCICSHDAESNYPNIKCDYRGNITDRLNNNTNSKLILNRVDLSGNGFDVLPENYFRFIEKIYILDLSENNLELVSSSAIGAMKLKVVFLTNNSITSLDNLTSFNESGLETLVLRSNKIFDLKTDIKFYNLTSLDVSQNIIRMIPDFTFTYLENVNFLNLSYNLIESISSNSFSRLTFLESIDLSHNSITTISNFALIPMFRLTTLNLSNNNLRTLSREQILVSSRKFSSIDISRNALVNLDAFAFSHMTNLKKLNVANNHQLGTYMVNNMRIPKHLRDLDVSFCGVTQTTNCEWMTGMLEKINLEGNILDCGCKMLWLWYWYKNRVIQGYHSIQKSVSKWRCYKHKNVSIPFESVTPNRLLCDYNDSACPLQYPELKIDVDVHSIHKHIEVKWSIQHFAVVKDIIFGYRIIVKHNGQSIGTTMLHPLANAYEYTDINDLTTYHFCLAVFRNETVQWGKGDHCVKFYTLSNRYVTGIIAALVFMVPCAGVVIWLLNKDRVYRARLVQGNKQSTETTPAPTTDKEESTKL